MSAAALAVFAPGAALAGTLDQQQDAGGGTYSFSSATSTAQTFTAGVSGGLDQVDIYVGQNVGSAIAPVTVEIRNVTGGVPGTTVLSSRSLPSTSFEMALKYVSFQFSTPAPVVAGTQYAIVASSTESTDSYRWATSATDVYAGGADFQASPPGGAWSAPGSTDLRFKTYVVPAAVTPPVTPTTTPPVTTTPPPADTGQRAAALKKCKSKKSKKAKRNCRKKAAKLPV